MVMRRFLRITASGSALPGTTYGFKKTANSRAKSFVFRNSSIDATPVSGKPPACPNHHSMDRLASLFSDAWSRSTARLVSGIQPGAARSPPAPSLRQAFRQRRPFTLVIACTPGNWTETERCRPFLLVELGFARDAESESLGARTWTPAWKPLSSGHKKADPSRTAR